MSNLVTFLDRLGADARLATLDGDDYRAAVDALGLAPELRDALLRRDGEAITALVRAQPMMLILAPGEEAPADDEDEDEDDQDDESE